MNKIIIETLNSHWSGKKLDVPKTKRLLLNTLEQDLNSPLISYLIGQRRVGKSVALKQSINYLMESGVEPTQILFYEFSNGDIVDLIWEIYDFFKQEVSNPSEKIYLFFDEIQFIKNYEATIKLIYDQVPNLKIILTGSLSLSYKRKMEESLVGRFIPIYFYPLCFEEYLILSNSEHYHTFQEAKSSINIVKAKAYLEILNPIFREFLKSGRYPQVLTTDNLNLRLYLESVVNQSINQDAINYFNIQKPQLLNQLFQYFNQNNGAEISILNLSSQTGASRQTIKEYISVLELMGLIYILENSQNPLKSSQNNPKIYVSSTWSLNFNEHSLDNLGLVAESYVLERMLENGKKLNYFREKNKEVDLVIWAEKVAVEIKFKAQIVNKDFKNLFQFSQLKNLEPKIYTIYPQNIESVQTESILLL